MIERTHLAVKSVADKIENTGIFERSVLASLSTRVWGQASEPAAAGLLGRVARTPGSDIWVADSMDTCFVEVSVDDVVLRGTDVGVVRACCQAGVLLFCYVEVLHHVRDMTPHSVVVRPSGNLASWRAADCRLPRAWRSRADGAFVVVRE